VKLDRIRMDDAFRRTVLKNDNAHLVYNSCHCADIGSRSWGSLLAMRILRMRLLPDYALG
jgi:hypothetical protein